MTARRTFLCRLQREAEVVEKKSQVQNSPFELEEDILVLAEFFAKFYQVNPEVLSCLVQFYVIHFLKLTTSQDIENLKFGDFIHHEDENDGEYFCSSKRLERIFFSSNRPPWLIQAKPLDSICPFPCPVKVLKFYMSKQEPSLISKPSNLAIMALLLQPIRTLSIENEHAWYSTQYYKPKSLLVNVFSRTQAW